MAVKECSPLRCIAMISMACILFQVGCNSTDSPTVNNAQSNQADSRSKAEPATTALQDADEVYTQALARAEQEKKNVFVHLSGPG